MTSSLIPASFLNWSFLVSSESVSKYAAGDDVAMKEDKSEDEASELSDLSDADMYDEKDDLDFDDV